VTPLSANKPRGQVDVAAAVRECASGDGDHVVLAVELRGPGSQEDAPNVHVVCDV
jgi:hypothetical protein